MSLKSSNKLRHILEVRASGEWPLWVHAGCWQSVCGCCALLALCPQAVMSLQIVLAFGNYMNSSKRGAAYGFRLQSLDAVGSVWGAWGGGDRGTATARDQPWGQRDTRTSSRDGGTRGLLWGPRKEGIVYWVGEARGGGKGMEIHRNGVRRMET